MLRFFVCKNDFALTANCAIIDLLLGGFYEDIWNNSKGYQDSDYQGGR